ncbi:hypothetical protein J437_LFUL017437 [Ladona fulva]|uniref:Nuclease HARBI1 n=1 Tax=Ladona fulva TaxID=123851 RepID=A0A8K0KN58_LADFU|nr:hypothetical protein J437_LFUL017437 [Ladona fulva]
MNLARFCCLLRHRVLEYTPPKAGCIVNACAVLHNMCLRSGVNNDILPRENNEDNVPVEQLPPEQMPQIAVTGIPCTPTETVAPNTCSTLFSTWGGRGGPALVPWGSHNPSIPTAAVHPITCRSLYSTAVRSGTGGSPPVPPDVSSASTTSP